MRMLYVAYGCIDLLEVNLDELKLGEAAGIFFENRSYLSARYNRVWPPGTFNNIFPWIWGRYTRHSPPSPTATPLFTYFPNGSGIFMKVSRKSFIHGRTINCYINYEMYRPAPVLCLKKRNRMFRVIEWLCLCYRSQYDHIFIMI